MSHPIPEDAQRLATRLRMLAEELESAARYGIPIPYMVSVTGHEFGNASFHLPNVAEFDAWADYTEANVNDYDHADQSWSRAAVDVNGLPVEFSTCRGPVFAVAR